MNTAPGVSEYFGLTRGVNIATEFGLEIFTRASIDTAMCSERLTFQFWVICLINAHLANCEFCNITTLFPPFNCISLPA